MKNILNIILIFTMAFLIFSTADSYLVIPKADAGYKEFSGDQEDRGRLNLTYNAFYNWQTNFLIRKVSDAAQNLTSRELNWKFILTLSCMLTGIIFMFQEIKSSRGLPADLLAGSLISFVLLILYGYDSPVIFSLVWVPLLLILLSMIRTGRIGVKGAVAGALVLGYLINKDTNHLAPVVLAGAIFALRPDGNAADRNSLRGFWATLVLISLLLQMLIPYPVIPSYPGSAHVVADDGVPGNVMPLTGLYPGIPFIDRTALKTALAPAVWIALAISGWTLLYALIKKESLHRPFVFVAFVLAAAAALDICAPEKISLISPALSLSRIIPGLYCFAVSPVLLAFSVFLLFTYLHLNKNDLTLSVLLLAIVTIPIYLGQTRHTLFGVFQGPNSRNALDNLESLYERGKISEENFRKYARILVSPSYSLINSNGLWIVTDAERLSAVKPLSLRDRIEEIETFTNNQHNLGKKVTNKGGKLRWSAGRGRQIGDEWLRFRLKEPVQARGIKISCGRYTTDFPRGLRITGSKDCGPHEILRYIPAWEGSIRYTRDLFPYYTGQNEVEVLFPKETRLHCLKAEQIGRSDHFDWSVTEIELLH